MCSACVATHKACQEPFTSIPRTGTNITPLLIGCGGFRQFRANKHQLISDRCSPGEATCEGPCTSFWSAILANYLGPHEPSKKRRFPLGQHTHTKKKTHTHNLLLMLCEETTEGGWYFEGSQGGAMHFLRLKSSVLSAFGALTQG